jgi:hypothetical protein
LYTTAVDYIGLLKRCCRLLLPIYREKCKEWEQWRGGQNKRSREVESCTWNWFFGEEEMNYYQVLATNSKSAVLYVAGWLANCLVYWTQPGFLIFLLFSLLLGHWWHSGLAESFQSLFLFVFFLCVTWTQSISASNSAASTWLSRQKGAHGTAHTTTTVWAVTGSVDFFPPAICLVRKQDAPEPNDEFLSGNTVKEQRKVQC